MKKVTQTQIMKTITRPTQKVLKSLTPHELLAGYNKTRAIQTLITGMNNRSILWGIASLYEEEILRRGYDEVCYNADLNQNIAVMGGTIITEHDDRKKREEVLKGIYCILDSDKVYQIDVENFFPHDKEGCYYATPELEQIHTKLVALASQHEEKHDAIYEKKEDEKTALVKELEYYEQQHKNMVEYIAAKVKELGRIQSIIDENKKALSQYE